MSPAPIAEETQPELHLDQLHAVGKAFDALLLTLYRRTHRHNELKQHTQEVFKQVHIHCFLLALSLPLPNISNDERI